MAVATGVRPSAGVVNGTSGELDAAFVALGAGADVTPDPCAGNVAVPCAKPPTGGELFAAGPTFERHGVALSLAIGDAAVSIIDGLPRQLLAASGVMELDDTGGALDASAGSPRMPDPRGIDGSFVIASARS